MRSSIFKVGIFSLVLFVLCGSVLAVSPYRLPTVGGDSGTWGTVLNEFLNVSLDEDGSIRQSAIDNIYPSLDTDVNDDFTPTDLAADYEFTDNSVDWDTAFDWGNHADVGYLTSYDETDPKIGILTTDKWCNTDGISIMCDSDAPVGPQGDAGPAGVGVPAGGTAGQILCELPRAKARGV